MHSIHDTHTVWDTALAPVLEVEILSLRLGCLVPDVPLPA